MLTANSRVGRLSAYVAGKGPSIVFLHSLLADRGSLEPMLPLLCDDFRLIFLDLPGFGESPAVSGGLNNQADEIAESVQVFCHDEAPLLFGNGYGAFLALALALRHPKSVCGLFLAGCGAGFSEEGRKAFEFMAARTAEYGLQAIADTAMRRLFPPEMAEKEPEQVAERRARFLSTNPDVFRDACSILAIVDFRSRMKDFTLPVLACAGALDEATPPAMAQELAALTPHATSHVIPNCAHVPTLQAPKEVAKLVRHFAEAPDRI